MFSLAEFPPFHAGDTGPLTTWMWDTCSVEITCLKKRQENKSVSDRSSSEICSLTVQKVLVLRKNIYIVKILCIELHASVLWRSL